MNEQCLREVHTNDLPQRVRNTMAKEEDDVAISLTKLKVEINNFCWMYLPASTTIREAEVIACKIFRLMCGSDLGLAEIKE
jgi:hypothetical protein